MSITLSPKIRILKMKSVADVTGLSPTHIRRLVEMQNFPQPVPLSAGRLGWVEAEVQSWLRARVDARDAARAA